jgi:hypothetical protein
MDKKSRIRTSAPVAHPVGETVGIDLLAEAETFIIRKTIIEILKRGWPR